MDYVFEHTHVHRVVTVRLHVFQIMKDMHVHVHDMHGLFEGCNSRQHRHPSFSWVAVTAGNTVTLLFFILQEMKNKS